MNGQSMGIDLGTYNSCAAYATDDGQVQMIKSHYGPTPQGQVFPSFVRFDALGNVVAYGEDARQQMAIAPDRVVWGVKRLIGRPFRQAEKEIPRFAYPIEQGPDGGVVIPIGSHRYTPVDISALILKWIKQNAETLNPFIVGPIRKAVVTHPAYFDALQTRKTREAAEQAGFEEVELIAEPVAAALAYGLQLDATRPRFIVAIDWGAGTLDIAIVALRLGRDGRPILDEVRPARGDVALGGIDMDDLLLARVVEVYGLEAFQPLVRRPPESIFSEEAEILSLIEPSLPPEMRSVLRQLQEMRRADYQRPAAGADLWGDFCRLRDAIERAKIELSRVPATRAYATYQGRPVQIKMARTRRDCLDGETNWVILEEVLQPLLGRFRSHIEFALQQSGLRWEDIQHVLLIGGPMHMPCVRQVVKDLVATNPQVTQELKAIAERGFPVDPMEAVARGAALYARNAGPRPGASRINRDYGVLLGTQGEILIHDGDGLPCQASLPGTLAAPGRPGESVPVGLYMREYSPESSRERYIRLGNYEFWPMFNAQGMCTFKVTLEANREGIISLILTDELSGGTLTLEQLSRQEGQPIPKPHPFEWREPGPIPPIPPGTPPVLPPPPPPVPEQTVLRLRRLIANTLLPLAKSKMDHPRVQASRDIRDGLGKKIKALEEAMRKLPSRGPVDQKVFQNVANRATELRAFLDVHQLLTDEERTLLFG